MNELYKIECDLFEDPTEVWPDDLLLLPHPAIDHMVDALVEDVRRKLAVNSEFPPELLPKIRETMRIVPALEGDAARAYFAEKELSALASRDWKRAKSCRALLRQLDAGAA